MSGALGVDAVEDGDGGWDGLSALEHRLILGAQLSPGLLGDTDDVVVTPSPSSMSYEVGPVVAACSRGVADGVTIGFHPGATLSTTPGAGLPRVDMIYALQHNPEHGDADNQMVLAVAQGVPASTPVRPTPPVGGLEIRSFRVPAGAVNLSGATLHSRGRNSLGTDTSRGVLFEKSDPNNGSYGTTPGVWISGEVTIPTARLLIFRASIKVKAVAGSSGADPEELQMVVRPFIDGSAFAEGYTPRWDSLNNNWYHAEFEWTRNATAGTHTVGLQYGRVWGNAVPHGVYDGGLRRGTSLTVIDGGSLA